MEAIEIHQLSKTYDGKKNVLDHVDFKIPEGQIFGLLGPNGSGKTTMVRIVNGILQPSDGGAYIFGMDIKNKMQDIHKISGVMTETAALYDNLTGEENLNFFGKLHDMNDNDIKKCIKFLLDKLELTQAKDQKVIQYSTGMKKRLAFAVSVLHKPKVLFLDEPTSGLDPENAMNVSEFIKEMVEKNGVTAFLCTHQLKYAETLCTLYGLLHDGVITGFGTFEQLLAKKHASTFIVIKGAHIPESEGLVKVSDNTFKKIIKSDQEAWSLISDIVNKGAQIYDARQEHWSLEELYLSYERGDRFE